MTEKQQIFAALYVYTHALDHVKKCKTFNQAIAVCRLFNIAAGICSLFVSLDLMSPNSSYDWLEYNIRDGSIFWYDTPSMCDFKEEIIECLEFRLNKLKELYYEHSTQLFSIDSVKVRISFDEFNDNVGGMNNGEHICQTDLNGTCFICGKNRKS